MDPSCGKCTSSDCNYREPYTDPNCPEHGTAARAAVKAELEAEVARLTSKTLRKLVRRKPRELPDMDPTFQIRQRPPTGIAATQKSLEIIQDLSESMVGLARIGQRRKKLLSVHVAEGAKPEDSLTEVEQRVHEHFRARVRTVFREVWREHGAGEYELWATW